MTIRQLNFANLADKDSTEQQEVRPRRGRKSLTVIGPANFAESCLYCLIYPTVIKTQEYGIDVAHMEKVVVTHQFIISSNPDAYMCLYKYQK